MTTTTRMIAVNEPGARSMVLIYKTLRGYTGGNVEPVTFHSEPLGTCDDSLAALGYKRDGDWTPVSGGSVIPGTRAFYAKVTTA